MSTETASKLGVALAVPALLAAGLLPSQGASASAPTPRSACDGVRLLAASYVVIGMGDLIVDVSGPVSDQVHCQAVNLRGSGGRAARASAGDCKNAQVAGARLKPRLAAKSIRCLINEQRRERGLNELDAHKTLKKAAKRHTAQMLSTGCFSHTCPGEPDLVSRVTSTGYLPCDCSWSVAENIAWGQGKHGSPAAIVAAWMASPPHRETILTEGMRDVGIGVRPGKPGDRQSSAASYTADFGYRN
jgi:uncharacterized protein YkwD